MRFKTIDVKRDRGLIVQFRRDSYVVSFGSDEAFGDEDAYVKRIEERARRFPKGQVLVEEAGDTIGQLELQIVEYEGREIGYVNLYYLVPAYRGRGVGKQLVEYAERFFRKHRVQEYHLRVASTNERAIRFYIKHGMTKLKEEASDNPVWRMQKQL
ncbi:GNAT family N-acetyltransferase [Ectobacillus ponti]|uniref:GNAT family N-acetyltransferase n=1 Tax=Ectobacillus ponti TaxID=2961894 RepID=A0AA41X9R1_9BACI|nr:GNAT family N-acetyltransferase [Ectobacillus ponti]MCP8968955.1 GNAT family N-acetyltransferase [Ectobacillus ponti]